MLSLPAWKCPEWTFNASLVNTSSPEFTEEWQKRIREVMGQGEVDWVMLYYDDVLDNFALVLFISRLLPKSALVRL